MALLNLAHTVQQFDDLLGLEAARLDQAIARQLGYRLGRELSPAERRSFSDPQYDDQWFALAPDQASYEPLKLTNFSSNTALILSLPLPHPTDRYEDWIHTEIGPRGRWIVRLLRFSRTGTTQPWKSKELFVADRDEDPIPLATAYGRAWLFSHYTWPEPRESPASKAA